MERRNFLGMLAGTLLAPFGYGVANSCNCDTIPKPDSTEIIFYGLFTNESLENIDTILPGDPVFVTPSGCCELRRRNQTEPDWSEYTRLIGTVKDVDKNGILVSMNAPICKIRKFRHKQNLLHLKNHE